MDGRRALFPLLSLLVAALPLAACEDEGGSDGSGASASSSSSSASSSSSSSGSGGAGGSGGQGGGGGSDAVPVALQFEGRVGAEVFSCSSPYPGLGTAATEVSISDFRLYIHDVRLHRANAAAVPVVLDQDGVWQYHDVVLLDFEDKSGSCGNGTAETNGTVRGTVPAGEYDGISFKLGVPFELNHADAAAAPSPLNLSGLFWSWNGGYKFARIDSAVTAEGGGPFVFHLGSTGCIDDPSGTVSSCDRPNVADIVLTGFDPLATKVLVDFAALVATSDLSVNVGGPPGCMSGPTDPECLTVFEQLGIDISDGSLHPEQQTFFRVE